MGDSVELVDTKSELVMFSIRIYFLLGRNEVVSTSR